MADEIEKLKQAEKEKLANWETELATEADIIQIKVEEEEAASELDPDETEFNWVPYLFIALGVIALLSMTNFNFGWCQCKPQLSHPNRHRRWYQSQCRLRPRLW